MTSPAYLFTSSPYFPEIILFNRLAGSTQLFLEK